MLQILKSREYFYWYFLFFQFRKINIAGFPAQVQVDEVFNHGFPPFLTFFMHTNVGYSFDCHSGNIRGVFYNYVFLKSRLQSEIERNKKDESWATLLTPLNKPSLVSYYGYIFQVNRTTDLALLRNFVDGILPYALSGRWVKWWGRASEFWKSTLRVRNQCQSSTAHYKENSSKLGGKEV